MFLVLALVGIQATVSSQDVGTETTVMLPDVHLSSTPITGSMFRPSKRPRLVLEEEEEEEEEDTETEVQVEPHNSTYKPDCTATEESELS